MLAASGSSSADIDRARRALEDVERQHEAVRARIRQESPKHAALALPQPLSLRDVQEQVLDADTLLLAYVFAAGRTFLWAVTQTSATTHELAPRATVEGAARRAYQLLLARNESAGDESADGRRRRLARADQDAASALDELGRLLLAPVSTVVAGKRLLIVPDGALHYVPFAALPAPSTADAAPHPLVADHEIVTAPSASTIASLRRGTSGPRAFTSMIGVFADPVFGRDDPRLIRDRRRDGTPGDSPAFARLRFSRDEATAIAAVAGDAQARVALDFEANRHVLVTEAGRYRILHLATHGVVDSRRPDRTGIVFSLVDPAGQPQDGLLRLGEI